MQVNSPDHWSRSQLAPVIKCPGCGSAELTSTVFERHDNDGSILKPCYMVQCGDCQSLRLDQRPMRELCLVHDTYYPHNAEPEEIKRRIRGLASKLIHGYLNQRLEM